MFHLGWFVGSGFGLQSWKGKWSGDARASFLKPDLYIDLARSLEQAASRPSPTARHWRGLTRSQYQLEYFKDNLLAF